VIATGRNGLVTFMNPVAEALTGWDLKEALGKDLTEVFHIINHETRRPVENPVTRAIREGIVVGLAKHSILIAKNGTETPIGDTAAPVRGDTGTIIGSVLVFRDITEWAEHAAELARSNVNLEQFAHVASHDLQEPLRMVVLYTQLLAKRYRGKLDAEADEFIGYAVDGAKRMVQLTNDLLAYSRVSSRGQEFEPTDCEAVLKLALTNLQAAVQESGVVVTHDPLPTVTADRVQLGQLFQNLISNAIKFHGEVSPCIHVSAKPKGKEWVFSVEDNGIGIEPQYTERIFAIFQRLHSPKDYSGTGIGLAICKKIVECHGGRVWVESQPGQGATFYFTLSSERRRTDRRRENQKAEPSAKMPEGLSLVVNRII
jgi:PAS domain S-box-containing protein